MIKSATLSKAIQSKTISSHYLLIFLAGLLGPLGFAPFHMPGFSILSLSVFFSALFNRSLKECLYLAFAYGLGFFGLGVSWIIISIHDYGGLNYCFAALITLVFIAYLTLFPMAVGLCFKLLKVEKKPWLAIVSFSALWCLSEYLRAHLMTGFPWLLLGITTIDTPLKYLAPIVGIYGLSFLCACSAGLLSIILRENSSKRYYYLISFLFLLTAPSLLKSVHWTKVDKEVISVAAIQGNLSMRDKWDEHLFWNLLKYYARTTEKLLGTQLIILPESAIPLPSNYLEDYLRQLDEKAKLANSALLLGILQPTNEVETHYYNAIHAYGHASGFHIKQELVPFGEYIPWPFSTLCHWLNIPQPNVLPGKKKQALIKVFNHPIASLICYEIAYPKRLLQQLPEAQWIVSISDNGWFGRSLASYQQVQMSQMLSLLAGRFQVVVNNDGLSSIIDDQGNILEGLPPFSAGLLQSELHSAHGLTPWIIWNEQPTLIFCSICLFFILIYRIYCWRKQVSIA